MDLERERERVDGKQKFEDRQVWREIERQKFRGRLLWRERESEVKVRRETSRERDCLREESVFVHVRQKLG